MALQGPCTYTTEFETGEYTTQTVELGDGTTEEMQIPVMEVRTEEYEDIYIIVKQITQYQNYDHNGKHFICAMHMAGYLTPEHRDLDVEDHVLFDVLVLTDYNHEENIFTQCYNHIKTVSGFENLVDC
tara:strand:+ start:3771 stop:4154 length:384 start_codon:yes stop_codon:yes gene_type:complete